MPVVLALALVLVAGLVACGGDDSPSSATATAPASAAGAPALATRAARPGEIVVRGETSPETHGPYEFDGRYLVRFEQYAPEDPALDFSAQTPFTAQLTRSEGDARGAIDLFQDARGSGRRELSVTGRRYVDVSFGDFPYVIRFTPRRR